ncbi:hypothetical protein BDK51DRAFT_51500 [Blyttiomyces helicus]|uniref:Uncharacterized protein n=1 Tax=Blyttiomyces helicus TaxID=388810 RepID=A0A4P9W3A3_9FUNG|nr:hypothetical protein BDK51DRAFT_51500 [Blyttiomyces helicus]|eukprot:RKO86272.1 hypothetical protein BDK51DRAFT_51500 [Blyttiomyces helicus]
MKCLRYALDIAAHLNNSFIPLIDIKGPQTKEVTECIYQNDFRGATCGSRLRLFEAININGYDINQAHSITDASLHVLRGNINNIHFTTSSRQLLDKSQTLARFHLFGIPLKNRRTVSPSLDLIRNMGDSTIIIIVITDKVIYTLHKAISSFLCPLSDAITVHLWLFSVGKLRPWCVLHEFSIKQRMKKLNLLNIIENGDCEAPLTSSISKPATAHESAFLRHQVFFYLKEGRHSFRSFTALIPIGISHNFILLCKKSMSIKRRRRGLRKG